MPGRARGSMARASSSPARGMRRRVRSQAMMTPRTRSRRALRLEKRRLLRMLVAVSLSRKSSP